jgi:2,4-diaminopentanoate dehydrogenase
MSSNTKRLRAPYRVAVWGPGPMGQAAIREVIRLPETELVAVLGYNKENDGADVSKIIGGPATGIKVTTDFNNLLRVKPEVVIHTARFFGDFRADDEIIKLLESGINVISVQPYQYPRARGADVQKKFEDACKRGDTTLHGSGIDPGFLYERMAALATGLTNDVKYIKLQEFVRLNNHGPEILVQFGFTTTPAEMEKNSSAPIYVDQYLTMGMHFLADHLGMPIERIERSLKPTLAPQDFTTQRGLTAKKGTVAYLWYTWTGYVKGKPFFIIETHWYLDDIVKPAQALHPYYWAVEVEGIPSVRLGLQATGSFVENKTITERSPTPGDYLATVVPAIQAIPATVDGPAGVLEMDMPQFHWKPDMRL